MIVAIQFLSFSDPMQLVMKTVMHELDYDMDDDDFKFLKEMNQKNKSKRMKTFIW